MAPTGGTDGTVVHGTAITLGDRAVLLRGPSGTGKSDLALRAIGVPIGCLAGSSFELVGDDQVIVRLAGDHLMVHAHPRLAGLLEVRGLGILRVSHVAEARLELIADLAAGANIERLPDPWPVTDVLGVALPVVRISPFEGSAALKLALALMQQPWRTDAN